MDEVVHLPCPGTCVADERLYGSVGSMGSMDQACMQPLLYETRVLATERYDLSMNVGWMDAWLRSTLVLRWVHAVQNKEISRTLLKDTS